MAATFALGLIADCQYADKPMINGRSYRESLDRLSVAIEALNAKPLKAVLHLGDVIDGRSTLEASTEDLAVVLQTFGGLRHELFHAVGNHDLAVPRPHLEAALALNAAADTGPGTGGCYSSRRVPDTSWWVIVLDTVHVCKQWVDEGRQPADPEADRWLLEHAELPNATFWNGMLGEEQRQWLDNTLSDCDASGDRVLVFGHHPLLPAASDATHCAWDGPEAVEILDSHASVAAYFCGHDHRGGYAVSPGGVHHTTLAGMVETPLESNAYGVLTVRGTSPSVSH